MLNKVILHGRLGETPELKVTPSGTEVVTVSIAVTRDFKNKNGEAETDWISVVAWKNTAIFMSKYFKKGSQILVEGSLQVRSYIDKNDKKCYVTEVVANNVYFAGDKSEKTGDQNAPTEKPADSFINPEWFVEEEQLPF